MKKKSIFFIQNIMMLLNFVYMKMERETVLDNKMNHMNDFQTKYNLHKIDKIYIFGIFFLYFYILFVSEIFFRHHFQLKFYWSARNWLFFIFYLPLTHYFSQLKYCKFVFPTKRNIFVYLYSKIVNRCVRIIINIIIKRFIDT